MVVIITSILVVNPAVPAHSVRELIDLAKAKPGTLSYASTGNGTPTHLAAELFKHMAGVDIVHVPYKGGAPAAVDLLAGQVQLSFISAPAVMPHVKSGRLRALAVTNARRSQLLPQLPTIAESGLPGYESEGWHGLCGPARLPRRSPTSFIGKSPWHCASPTSLHCSQAVAPNRRSWRPMRSLKKCGEVRSGREW